MDFFSVTSIAVGVGTFVFHVTVSTILQYAFYYAKPATVAKWKIQPQRKESLAEAGSWWLPLLRLKSRHKPLQWIYCTLNLCTASLFAAVTAELFLRDKLPLKLTGPFWWPLLASCAFQCTAEYHWHRLLHTKLLYQWMHKTHHLHVAPEPFDDFMVNPLELAIYQCIFFGPAFLFDMQLPCFAVYLALHGFAGIADHSGIHADVPLLYRSKFHDDHHKLFTCNFGFPFAIWDHLHGTFRESD